ncbi:MAG: hypothetical protein Q8L39_12130 [Burkholderiales bacterium]|nr:hypothetical protein [Burkholderiales bacterium]
MALLTQDVKFTITPQSCGEEGDCIQVQISGEQSVVLCLTPQQARAMASDLIQTVYRAEVKNSLLSSQRRSTGSKSDTVTDKYAMHSPHAA